MNAAAGWCLRWLSFELSTSPASVGTRSFLSRGSFLWERKPRLMPNQLNFKGSCFGLSLGRSLGPKLRPNQASLDLCIKEQIRGMNLYSLKCKVVYKSLSELAMCQREPGGAATQPLTEKYAARSASGGGESSSGSP